MEPKDVKGCAEIVAKHPVIGPRYGNQIGDLAKAWLRVVGCEAANTTVFQSGDGPRAPICCLGVSLFVSDEFLREIKTPPLRWVGPELARRILAGNSPVLSDNQSREANSRGGLNLLVWEGCIHPEFEASGEVPSHMMTAFIEVHSGFLLKEIINVQVENVDRLQWTLQSGGLLWNPVEGCYQKSSKKDPKEIVRGPHIIGVTREIEIDRRASWDPSWVGSLFDYRPPQCGFNRSEQRMLLIALDGATDPEVAKQLNISLTVLKKRWLSVYHRMDDRLPRLNSRNPEPEVETLKRGKEKKRHLLAYLRQHPEELRPFSNKLLKQAGLGKTETLK